MQHAVDKPHRLKLNIGVGGDFTHDDALEKFLLCLVLEWVLTCEHDVRNDAKCPDVGCKA